ncbi:MAG: hypothetical protein V4667_12000 [Bacteroidota bacterium]
MFKLILSIVTLGIVLTSCTTNPEVETNSENKTNMDSTTENSTSRNLKNLQLNYETVITSTGLTQSTLLTKEEEKIYSLNKIDVSYSGDNFIYHFFETVFTDNKIKVILLGREYESENCIWLCVFDKEHNLLDTKEVYYDNAEGFKSVTSTIKNNTITIITNNDFAENENEKTVTENYSLTADNKLVKL